MTISAETTWGTVEVPPAPVRRFTVREYHRMIDMGVFGPQDRVELLNGWIIQMSPHNPRHDTSVGLTEDAVRARLPTGWILRVQASITLSDSEPGPDIAVVRGERRRYGTGHPTPPDTALVVEVSDSSLRLDRLEKGPTYAREGIAVYWIANIAESKLEAYSEPSLSGYRQRDDYGPDETVPLILDGSAIATIPVRDLLP